MYVTVFPYILDLLREEHSIFKNRTCFHKSVLLCFDLSLMKLYTNISHIACLHNIIITTNNIINTPPPIPINRFLFFILSLNKNY